jgi:hypothetical protein
MTDDPPRLTWSVAAVLIALGLGLVVAPVVAASAAGPSPAAGCDAPAPVVAHRAGGTILSPPPTQGPVACTTTTGFAAAESHIAVGNNGTVIYTPAVLPSGAVGTGEGPPVVPSTQANATPAGLAVTTDNGAHWSLVRPFNLTWNPTDHGDYVDAATGRFFYEDYGPIPFVPALGANQEGPAHMMWTDDFRTWHHTTISNLVLPENPRFTSARAPSGRPSPVGYADIVYFCANSNVGFTSPAILGRYCFKSLDGGTSWTQTSQLFSSIIPRHAECGQSGENVTAIDGYYPEPASDGSLYVLVACGGKTYLARSTDEGTSFPIIHSKTGPLTLAVPIDAITALGSGPQLRIDSSDNFYLVYPQLNGSTVTKLFLRISADRGVSWSKPLDITVPGVTAILRWAVAERGSGHLEVAAVAHRAGQTTWDGYVTVTRTALDVLTPGGQPLLWSADVTPRPLLYADHITGAGYIVGQGEISVPLPFPLGIQPIGGAVSAGNDFMGAAIGPDATAWASFNQDCGPTPGSTGCQADSDQTRGVVGRLVWAAAVSTPVPVAPTAGPVTSTASPRPGTGLPATGSSPWLPALGVVLCGAGLAVARLRRRSAS